MTPAPEPRAARSLGRLAALLAWACAVPVVVGTALALAPRPLEIEARQPLIHREMDFVGANACRSCHPDHYASWRRTFHSSMTQRPDASTVQGAFDALPVHFYGKSALPFARDDGYFFRLPSSGGGERVARVALTVGSRRYQQYFEAVETPVGTDFLRLPLLWHNPTRRWIHLNAVFLAPDDDDWERHRAVWNANCIFCHNTGPRPGLRSVGDRPSLDTMHFDSRAAELGIACEACHGPGATHAARQRNPLRRYAAYRGEDDELRIVHPEKLDRARAVGLCGQCHGQRLPRRPEDIWRWLDEGPSFRSGERLREHAAPISASTASIDPEAPDLYRDRFWGDGTPRLTAYEYQGITHSPCYLRGEMTCGSCHSMHGGDVYGMIEPEMRTNEACLQCHAELAADPAAHTRHDPEASGSACMDCHMPRIVYGVLEIHRSHRIEIPDPVRDAEAGRPNACTGCHLDRSPRWAAEETARLWGSPARLPAYRADRAPLDLPDASASLLAGDAVQRAVYAVQMGRTGGPLAPAAKGAARVLLAVTLLDPYPSVRQLAHRSLRALEAEHPIGIQPLLDALDPLAPIETRREEVERLLAAIARRGPGRLDAPEPGQGIGADLSPERELLGALLRLQANRVIAIGE